MKTFIIFAALAGLAYAIFKILGSGAIPQGRLSRVVELPGVAISKLSFSSGNPTTIVVVIGITILVLLVLYVVVSK